MPAPLTLQTPRLSDYSELVQVWEDSVRATHHFLPEGYIVLLRDHVLHRYLDAVMLVCCKDRQRICGFAGSPTGAWTCFSSHLSTVGKGLASACCTMRSTN